MNLKSVLSTLFILPLYAFAAITGTYEGHGVDLDNNPYTVTVFISENYQTYDVVWVYPDNTSDRGTGVLKDDAFAVVFQYGIQNYEISAFVGQCFYIGRGITSPSWIEGTRPPLFHPYR